MTDPVILRIIRPYTSVEEFLATEADTIDARGMLLVDAQPLPENTLIRFVVSLASGEAIIKAEGLSRAHVPPGPGRGGLKVRFKRFGGSTKELIDRALAFRAQPPPEAEEDSGPAATQVAPELSEPHAAPPPRLEPLPVRFAGAPPGRDAALDRLRERGRSLSPERLAQLTSKSALAPAP